MENAVVYKYTATSFPLRFRPTSSCRYSARSIVASITVFRTGLSHLADFSNCFNFMCFTTEHSDWLDTFSRTIMLVILLPAFFNTAFCKQVVLRCCWYESLNLLAASSLDLSSSARPFPSYRSSCCCCKPIPVTTPCSQPLCAGLRSSVTHGICITAEASAASLTHSWTHLWF